MFTPQYVASEARDLASTSGSTRVAVAVGLLLSISVPFACFLTTLFEQHYHPLSTPSMLNKKESSFVRSMFPLGRKRREEDSTTKDGGVRSTTKEEGPQSMPKDEGTLQTQSPPKEVRTELNPGEEWTISSLWKPIANTLEFIFRGAGEATSGASVPGLEGLIKGAIYVMDSADVKSPTFPRDDQ